MRDADDSTRRSWLVEAWREMDEAQRFAWNKLLTGEFRVGVSASLVVRSIAEAAGLDLRRCPRIFSPMRKRS